MKTWRVYFYPVTKEYAKYAYYIVFVSRRCTVINSIQFDQPSLYCVCILFNPRRHNLQIRLLVSGYFYKTVSIRSKLCFTWNLKWLNFNKIIHTLQYADCLHITLFIGVVRMLNCACIVKPQSRQNEAYWTLRQFGCRTHKTHTHSFMKQ